LVIKNFDNSKMHGTNVKRKKNDTEVIYRHTRLAVSAVFKRSAKIRRLVENLTFFT